MNPDLASLGSESCVLSCRLWWGVECMCLWNQPVCIEKERRKKSQWAGELLWALWGSQNDYTDQSLPECHGEAVFGEGRLGTAGSGIQRLWPENSDLPDESKRWLTLQLGAWGAYVPLFSKYLLSTYYVSGPVLGGGDTVVIEMCKVSSVMELTFQCCGVGLVTNNEQINMQCVAHGGNFKKKYSRGKTQGELVWWSRLFDWPVESFCDESD